MNNNIFYIHYNRAKYLATFKKELTLILPAQEIKAAPPLSQIFTQVGLNTNEFCEKFNKLTKIFPAGVLLPTSVFYTPKEKNFEICFRPFQLKLILQQYMELITSDSIDIQSKYQIFLIDLYKTLIIKSFIVNEKDLKRLFRSILGTLKSYEYPIEILYTLEDIKEILDRKLISINKLPFLIDNLDLNNFEQKEEKIVQSSLERIDQNSEENLNQIEIDLITFIEEKLQELKEE